VRPKSKIYVMQVRVQLLPNNISNETTVGTKDENKIPAIKLKVSPLEAFISSIN
jgi:hypothetical protein